MSFAKSLNFVLKWEGEYSNDPSDPGGETKYGISKRAYPELDIKSLTKEDAARIYYRDYWQPLDCDSRPDDLAMSVFDAGVNCGIGRVSKWLGEDFQGRELTAEEFNSRREYYYRVEIRESLRNRFLKGWLNRLNDLRKEVAKVDRAL